MRGEEERDESSDVLFNASRVLARSCETLLGICLGLLADHRLSEEEVRFLELWLRQNSALSRVWPASTIAARVRLAMADGVITDEELLDLKSTLEQLIGGSAEQTGSAGGLATRLPVDSDAVVKFLGRQFCFTGKFLFGTRDACQRAIAARGAFACDTVTTTLDYLVVGTLVSPDWAHSSHGRKIERAVAYRRNGHGIRIVHEEQWINALDALQ